jgi:hypothetical protein
MCVYFLNITINYAFFRTHSEYNRKALKKQYATFTLTSPTLKVTFHHPSPLFWEHELQQTYITHRWSVNKQNNKCNGSLQQSCSTRIITSTQVGKQRGRGVVRCLARALRTPMQSPHWSRLDWQPTSTQPWTELQFTRCSLRGQRTGFPPRPDRNSRLWIFHTSTCTEQSFGVNARELGCCQHV